jgi:DNA-binding response OmpR family regulator
LIVDDDLAVGEALAEVVEHLGYAADYASGGVRALKILAEANPPHDLILLDLMMPGMDGWEFRREQRKLDGVAVVPVVIISAADQLDRGAAEIGAIDVLRKPISMTRLKAAIRHVCGNPARNAPG